MITPSDKNRRSTLMRVGILVLNGVKVVSDAFHVTGQAHTESDVAVPVFNVFGELAHFTVDFHKIDSRSRIVREIRKKFALTAHSDKIEFLRQLMRANSCEPGNCRRNRQAIRLV